MGLDGVGEDSVRGVDHQRFGPQLWLSQCR